jgi:hypothetical protein
MGTSAEAVVFSASRQNDLCTLLRLMGMVRNSVVPTDTVVVDLSRLTQFGRYGTELLCEAQRRAKDRALSIRIVTGDDGRIAKVLQETGVAHRFARYVRLTHALNAPPEADAYPACCLAAEAS